jgi:hypothetical protein
MSEEEQNPNEVTDTPEPEAPKVPETNSLYDALFVAADEPEVDEQEEDLGSPISLSDAVDQLEDEPEQEPEVQAEDQEPEGDNQEAVKAEPEKTKPKKKKVKNIVDPDLETPEERQYKEQYNAFPETDPDKEFVDSLLPEERDIFDLAKFASNNLEGYEGKDREFKQYFEKTKKYIEKRISDDPHVDLSDDSDYQEFIRKNRPRFNQTDIRKIERERNIHEAMRRIEEKQAPERERAKLEQERARKAPEVHQYKRMFREHSVTAIPEELHEQVASEEAVQNFAKTNPLEYQIVDNITRDLHNVGDTLLDITQGMVSYDQNNEVHQKLLNWVNNEQDQYIATGETMVDGKTFMRRERFFRLPENQRSKYFTWSDEDLIKILTIRAKQRIKQSLDQQRQLLEASGYTRAQAQQAVEQAQQQVQEQPQPVQQQAPVRQAPPQVSSAPRPGNTPGSKPNPPQKTAIESVLGL